MPTVSINPPKTPITKDSDTICTATVPNVCKMPGPPAPFVPTPLPNIGKSGKSPQDGFSTTVKIEGAFVCIKGASFGSMGDIASKALGGGIVSMNCEGATKPVAPGSLDTKIEGKAVQFLGDQTTNNNGPSGSPPNSACMMGALHGMSTAPTPEAVVACAIQCCDKKPYSLPKNGRDDAIACQRLSNRKHSCVVHKLRETNASGKMTTTNKFPGVQASPRITGVPGVGRTLIPDTIVNGNKVIDAKFPCTTSNVTGPGYTTGAAKKSFPSLGKSGASMLTMKEKKDYRKIPGVKQVEAMSPADAEKTYPCDCRKS